VDHSPKRGEIWLTNFEPSVGTEIKKTRPALVISNDIANSRSSKVTVVPITGALREMPIVVIVEPDETNCLDKKSLIRVPDICTFDKSRLNSRIGALNEQQMREVDLRLKLHLGL